MKVKARSKNPTIYQNHTMARPSTKTTSNTHRSFSKSSSVNRRVITVNKPNRISNIKPAQSNESLLTILVKAFKHDYNRTLTYKESELSAWAMQNYHWTTHESAGFITKLKKTLENHECFRNVGRGTWTYIDQKAPQHLQGRPNSVEPQKPENDEGEKSDIEEEGEEREEEDDNEVLDSKSYNLKLSWNKEKFDGDMAELHDLNKVNGEAAEDMDMKDIDETDEDDLETHHNISVRTHQVSKGLRLHANVITPRSRVRSLSTPSGAPASPPATPVDGSYRMSDNSWLNLLTQMFKNSRKQKTVREMTTWIKDNFPIYQNAPPDWEDDIQRVLDSNQCFERMGRGRWRLVIEEEEHRDNDETSSLIASDSSSSTEEEDWRRMGPKRLISRRHSYAGSASRLSSVKTMRTPPPQHRLHENFLSYQPLYVSLRTPLSTFRSTKPLFDDTDDENLDLNSIHPSSYFSPKYPTSALASPPLISMPSKIQRLPTLLEQQLGSDDRTAIEALALLGASNSPL